MRVLLLFVVVACGPHSSRPETPRAPDERTRMCSGADMPVHAPSSCGDGDACYQLPDGRWCTGPRRLGDW